MISMITDIKELEKYPDVMSKDQFRRACHISCRKARWLLNSGHIPCVNTGKKTRCYKVQKSDVIKFVENYRANPLLYVMPAHADKRPRKTERGYISLSGVSPAKVIRYYKSTLVNEPEVLTTKRVSELTGYSNNTVLTWRSKGELRGFGKNMIPFRFLKEDLIAFLASDYYDNLIKKSKLHIRMIKEIKRRYGGEE